MKAISLHQPWATLIALGEKRIETRGKRINHRGLIAIHAAQKWTRDQADLLNQEPFKSRLAWHGITAGNAVQSNMPRGAIVAVADLIDDQPADALLCGGPVNGRTLVLTETERAFGNYAPGRRGYLLTNVRPLMRSVLCRGMQAVPFDVPPDVERLVQMELEGIGAI